MPDQTIADVEAQVADLTANAEQFEDIPPLRDEMLRRAAALTALLASHRRLTEVYAAARDVVMASTQDEAGRWVIDGDAEAMLGQLYTAIEEVRPTQGDAHADR